MKPRNAACFAVITKQPICPPGRRAAVVWCGYARRAQPITLRLGAWQARRLPDAAFTRDELDLALTALGNRVTARLGGAHRIAVLSRDEPVVSLVESSPDAR